MDHRNPLVLFNFKEALLVESFFMEISLDRKIPKWPTWLACFIIIFFVILAILMDLLGLYLNNFIVHINSLRW